MNSALMWVQSHPLPALGVAVLALAALVWLARAARRVPAAVLVASLAAIACTAYSADTSWRFAEHSLGMVSAAERAAMFAAAELALFSCALMARQNLRIQGAPGTPGILVWVITGVQVIPAYAESGIVGGTVRAVVGPVLAALLWHLAMGIELRHARPGTDSGSLPALLARELRERLLSRLGLAVRDRSAEQITRDRATVKAVALAAKLAEMKPGARGRARVSRRLSVAVGKAQAGASAEQRTKLLDLLAARRHAASLATITLASPWEPVEEISVERVPEERPELPPAPRPEVVPAGVELLPGVERPGVGDLTREEFEALPDHPFAEPPQGAPATFRSIASLAADRSGTDGYTAHEYEPEVTTGRAAHDQPDAVVPGREMVTPDSGDRSSDPTPTGYVDTPDPVDVMTGAVTTSVPAQPTREVVTQVVALTPNELLKRAIKLNRYRSSSGRRSLTIAELQDEFGLSRREATDLRRQVVMLEGR